MTIILLVAWVLGCLSYDNKGKVSRKGISPDYIDLTGYYYYMKGQDDNDN